VEEVIVRRLGNGMLTSFWKDVWLGDSHLGVKFPRLFSLSVNKEVSVGELLEVEEGRRGWRWAWRRSLFQWEIDKVTHLERLLENVSLSNVGDGWTSALNPEEGFSVKSAFDSLRELDENTSLSIFEEKIFSNIWESPTPSKVVATPPQLPPYKG
jgi:hypothetical protein